MGRPLVTMQQHRVLLIYSQLRSLAPKPASGPSHKNTISSHTTFVQTTQTRRRAQPRLHWLCTTTAAPRSLQHHEPFCAHCPCERQSLLGLQGGASANSLFFITIEMQEGETTRESLDLGAQTRQVPRHVQKLRCGHKWIDPEMRLKFLPL